SLDQLRRARCVAIRRREQRDADPDRQLERRVDELRRVLLVPVPAGVRERTEQALRLRELGTDPPVLRLAGRACQLPRPAGEDLLRSVGLPLAERSEEDA